MNEQNNFQNLIDLLNSDQKDVLYFFFEDLKKKLSDQPNASGEIDAILEKIYEASH